MTEVYTGNAVVYLGAMEKRAALALLEDGNGNVLAVSRKNNHEDLGFPGGKVEPHETYEEALVRELREETGCEALDFYQVFATEDGGGYWAIAFRVTKWSGTPVSREGASVRWVPRARLMESSCSWHDYNRALFERVALLDHLLENV